MGFFNPFSLWPSTASSENDIHNHSPDKGDAERHSWAFIQANGIDIVSQKTTPSPATEGAFKDLTYADKHAVPEANDRVRRSSYFDPDTQRDSKLSWRGSKRLSGIKTLLRSRKQHRQSSSEPSSASDNYDSPIDQPVERHYSHVAAFSHISETIKNQPVDTDEMCTQQANIQVEVPEQRKVSDQTVDTLESFDSERTSSTVCRHPSKCPAVQVILENRGYVYEKPFGDLGQSSRSSNLSADLVREATHSTRPSISDHEDENYEADHELPCEQNVSCGKRRPAQPSHIPRRSSIFRDISNISNESTWSAHIDQQKTAKAFNDMAGQLCLRPVALPDEEAKASRAGKPDFSTAEKLHRRNGLLHRIRSMRSNIQMRPQCVPPEAEQRRVRRMKTFANLSSRSDPFSTLKGKSLETLARLGGHSYLKPQGDFAPAVLKLPVCFAATATYLQSYGHRVNDLFFDPGDLKTAARIYEHFANQVLSAEQEEDKIQTTMRSNRMPVAVVEPLQQDTAPSQLSTYILSVGWVFKALLAGIPDGILGSRELYQVLVDISYGRQPYIVGKRKSKPQSEPPPETQFAPPSKLERELQSEPQLKHQKRPDDCLEGLTAWEQTQTKAIALAILSLTSKMHLELICAVFGLCEILLHQVQRYIEEQWVRNMRKKERLRPSWAAGLLDVDRFSRTLGPLLTNRASDGEQGLLREYRAVPSALQEERVVRMLLEHWRGVSRQLRWWERCGCPPERVILPPEEEEGEGRKKMKSVAEAGQA